MLKYFREAVTAYPGQFCVALFFIVCVTVMNAAMPWLTRVYLDRITLENSYAPLAAGLLLFAVYFLIKSLLHIAWFTSLDRFAGKYMESMTLRLMRRMAQTDYAEIEKIPGGTIRNILYSDVLNVFRVVGVFLPSLFSAVAILTVSLAGSLRYGVQTTLLILCAAAVGLLLSWCSRKALAKTAGTTNRALKVHDAWSTQFVDMLPLVMGNDILPYYERRTSENMGRFISAAIKEDRAIYFWQGVTNSYHALFTVALSALLAIPQAGNSIVNLVFFTAVANLVMQSAQRAELMFQSSMKNAPSFENIDTLEKMPCALGDEELDAVLSIEFDHVSFAYPSGVSALENVNCRWEMGETVVLTGQNGSGKSTMVKLLAGLYRPTSGEIRINGKPLRKYARASLNRQILYVNQDEKCLNETFRAYIEIMSGQAPTEETFEKWLAFVELPRDERGIEGNGASLSLGQRKKLYALKLLSRVERASVVILDELAAGMDAGMAEKLYGLLRQMTAKKDKIYILIEHGMPGGIDADKEICFLNGRML